MGIYDQQAKCNFSYLRYDMDIGLFNTRQTTPKVSLDDWVTAFNLTEGTHAAFLEELVFRLLVESYKNLQNHFITCPIAFDQLPFGHCFQSQDLLYHLFWLNQSNLNPH